MRTFENNGVYLLDFLYIKFKDKKMIYSIPLCEVIEGRAIKEKISATQIVILYRGKDGAVVPPEELTFTMDKFKEIIQKYLTVGKIEDIAIQPQGTELLPHVVTFLEKYK
jgi:hypothetical protein